MAILPCLATFLLISTGKTMVCLQTLIALTVLYECCFADLLVIHSFNNLLTIWYVVHEASFVLCPVKSSQLTYNAALNMPSYQSGTWSDGQVDYPPRLANDGSRHTTHNTGTRCAISNNVINPWWAVDLGRPTTVYRVDFTNMDHPSYGMRVATTDVNIWPRSYVS